MPDRSLTDPSLAIKGPARPSLTAPPGDRVFTTHIGYPAKTLNEDMIEGLLTEAKAMGRPFGDSAVHLQFSAIAPPLDKARLAAAPGASRPPDRRGRFFLACRMRASRFDAPAASIPAEFAGK